MGRTSCWRIIPSFSQMLWWLQWAVCILFTLIFYIKFSDTSPQFQAISWSFPSTEMLPIYFWLSRKLIMILTAPLQTLPWLFDLFSQILLIFWFSSKQIKSIHATNLLLSLLILDWRRKRLKLVSIMGWGWDKSNTGMENRKKDVAKACLCHY